MFAQSAGAIEYVDCISAERWDSPNECAEYDTKQSNGEVPVMLELWGMQSTPSLPLLLCPLWPGMVAPDRVLSMGKKKKLNWIVRIRTVLISKLMLNWIL